MPDSIMYQGDYFLVLEADQPEQFQTPDQLRDKLKDLMAEAFRFSKSFFGSS